MSNDLINRKEVLNVIDNMYQNEKDLIRSVWVRDSIRESIKEIPTVYDVDKVVERLEIAKSEIASETYCKAIDVELCVSRNCFECCAEYLIEIVKAGGKNVNS